ncbi:TPA: deoxyhypusine synthase family protein [Candidatus Woesearchaeota archaeon]|nr:deoxyhypusine synthase family protein [Candidatus Woesearchaeota archaeon]
MGHDWNAGDFPAIKDIRLSMDISVRELVSQFCNTGFQTHNIWVASTILSDMARENATIFLSFTSNISASGVRGVIIDLARRKKVHAIVVSSGALDEDIARAKMPYLQGSFDADDASLGRSGINRMGSIFVPNECYGYLEEKITEVLGKICSDNGEREFSATEIIRQIGLNLDTEDSFVYQAARNGIPIFCPGISDGAVGLQLAFFQQTHPGFKVNELKSAIEAIDFAMTSKKKGKVGAIILGGGIAKHHAIISNLLGGGLDYAIYVNSSSPYHGSLSGATTSEAKSWGKVGEKARDVTIFGDAAVVFPLLVASSDCFLE